MYRNLGDIETKILETIIHMGAQSGVNNVSSKKVAAECGISTGTIFSKFSTMQNALDAAAQYFDRIHMAKVVVMASESKDIVEIWDYFMDTLLQNPDGAMYYTSYTNTFGFDPTSNNPRSKEFLEIAKLFFKSNNELSDAEYLLIWDYITSMAFYYSEKFIKYLPYTDSNKESVRRIVFKGIYDFL